MRPVLAMLLTFCISLSATIFAGPLDPPAPPASTYKTLDEVEARIPIGQADIPLTILEDGSYYLTQNILIPGGISSPIVVSSKARHVSIDLNGYTIHDSLNASNAGIQANSALGDSQDTSLVVRNGVISGISGHGILAMRANVQISDLVLNFCGNGIIIGDYPGAVIRNCTINNIGGLDANPEIHWQGYTVGIRTGPESLVENCVVRGGALRNSPSAGLHGIWVTERSVVRNCLVADLRTSAVTTNFIVGIRASLGSIVEGCNVNNIGSLENTAAIVRGIWANQSTVRENMVRWINNNNSFACGIETLDGSRIVSNHVLETRGFAVNGILAAKEGIGSSVIEDNVVRRMEQVPFLGFDDSVGIVNNTSGGLTRGNSLQIDGPTQAGIAVFGKAHKVLSNTISFPTGASGSPAVAIIVRSDSTHTYVAGNVGVLCGLLDFGLDTILGTTPAPNHFGP